MFLMNFCGVPFISFIIDVAALSNFFQVNIQELLSNWGCIFVLSLSTEMPI